MGIHIIVIIVVALVSISAFSQPNLIEKYQFNAYRIVRKKEFVRLISHGFLHGSWSHLLVNMFVLFSFGGAVIAYYNYYLGGQGNVLFLIQFFSALVISSTYSLFKEKDNPYYNAIGASGAVSSVVFTSIFFAPYQSILLFAVIPIPGIIFGVVYLFYSRNMAKQNIDNVGHDAHFFGAVYGLLFPLFYDPSLLGLFFSELTFFM